MTFNLDITTALTIAAVIITYILLIGKGKTLLPHGFTMNTKNLLFSLILGINMADSQSVLSYSLSSCELFYDLAKPNDITNNDQRCRDVPPMPCDCRWADPYGNSLSDNNALTTFELTNNSYLDVEVWIEAVGGDDYFSLSKIEFAWGPAAESLCNAASYIEVKNANTGLWQRIGFVQSYTAPVTKTTVDPASQLDQITTHDVRIHFEWDTQITGGKIQPAYLTVEGVGVTKQPTTAPSQNPSKIPSVNPSTSPSQNPSKIPSVNPSVNPSTSYPSINPSSATKNPSKIPSVNPSTSPSKYPTTAPSQNPSKIPSVNPSTSYPSINPSSATKNPTDMPTDMPSAQPTNYTKGPTQNPSVVTTSEIVDVSETIEPTPKPTEPTTAASNHLCYGVALVLSLVFGAYNI